MYRQLTHIDNKIYNFIDVEICQTVVNEIKNVKVRSLIIGIIVIGISLIVFNRTPSEDELIINEIRQSYEKKIDLTQDQINHIKYIICNKEYLNGDANFMLGYLKLFVENNSEVAYKYFEEAIKKESITNEEFAIIYSYKFLAQKYIEEGNIDKGIEYTEKALYSINPKEHGEYRNLINDILRPVVELTEGRAIAIDFLEYIIIENYKHPNKQAEFYAYRTLEGIYMSKGNYTQSAQMSVKAIKLAKELGKEYFRGKSLINLARVNYKLGDIDDALEILEHVKDIKAEDAEWNDKLNDLRLLILYQINIILEKYDDALDIVNEFNNYKSNLIDEDRFDIEIMQNILMAHIYIIKDDLDLAKSYLNKASEIMKVDQVVYWTDKDIYYYITYGRMSEKYGDYKKAIECYLESRDLSIERDNIEAIKDSLVRLETVYNQIGDNENSRKYALELSEIKDYEKANINKDYMNYIAKKDEMKKVEDEMKIVEILNIILIIAIVVGVILAYKINIRPILKIKKLRKKVELNIHNNNYLTYYQPIINPKKNEIIGFEALLRLKEKDKIIMPYIIINEIEESNMMGPVSIWILNKIIEDYRIIKSNKNIKNDFYISMNISLKEIEEENIINEIINIISSSGLKRNAICIEITENIGANNMDKVAQNIVRLRKAGVMIAIDDFGVEYSNLSIVENIEYDIVKIDKTFINNIEKSDVNKNIIKFCDSMFGDKGKTIIIEGVEELNQVEFIKNTKASKFYIQGYFYSRPVEIDKIIEFEVQ